MNLKNPIYVKYHDEEWGRRTTSDRKLFELLTLEGAQAGLSWETILNKRSGYKKAFENFDFNKVANYSDHKLNLLLEDPSIVRNRLKVYSVRTNAQAFLEVREEFKTFNRYLESQIDFKIPKTKRLKSLKSYPTTNNTSDKISKDLKKRGFKFVGSTIIYSYLQAIGIFDDHMKDCFLA